MEWKNRYSISLISLISFVIFLVIALWFYIGNLEFQSQIAFILAEAAISIPITLILIEWVIKRDREKQWEKVKSLTYSTILYNLCYIALRIPFYMPTFWSLSDKRYVVIKAGGLYPKDGVSDIISELAKAIKVDIKQWTETTDDFVNQEQYDVYDNRNRWFCERLIDCHNDIGWFLEDIRISLIPRVLQLSDDPIISAALLSYEKISRDVEFLIRLQRTSVNVVLDHEVFIPLLEEIAKLYKVVQKNADIVDIVNNRRAYP